MPSDTAHHLVVYTTIGTKGSRTVGKRADGSSFTRPSSARQKPFAEAVAESAIALGIRIEEGQRLLSVVWYAPRPASHFTATGKLKKGVPLRPSVADGDKVLRNIADALEGIAWRNDRSVRPMAIDCHYGEPARCEIDICPCPTYGMWRYASAPFNCEVIP